MGDFTIDNLYIRDYPVWTEVPQPIWAWECKTLVDFSWFCLGHNFDVVATILTMAQLSWQRGFDARNVLEHFFDDKEVIADLRENEHYTDTDDSQPV